MYVKNPATGRDIKVDGPTYLKLKEQGFPVETWPRFDKPTPQRGPRVQPPSKQRLEEMAKMTKYRPDLKKTLARTTQPYLLRRLPEQIKRQEEGRGSRTRGWAADSPKRGTDRHLLRQKCGDKCFLIPDREAFPICPRCVEGQCGCEIDCRGLTAAKVRAHQYKYQELYEPIDQLMERSGCR
jgi:hypothetical protein